MVDIMTDDYSANSGSQQITIQTITPYILKEFKSYIHKNLNAIKQRKFLQIADLGCADGKNDTQLLFQLVKIVRKEISEDFQINIYMNDLPSTNASTIIKNVSLEIHDQNVLFFAVPKSFYEKLFPKNFIDVFLCLTTIHWLDKKHPAPYDKFVEDFNTLECFHHTQDEQGDYTKSKIYKHQEQTLQRFLRMRVKEMTSGGAIFVGNLIPTSDVQNVDEKFEIFRLIRKQLREDLEQNDIPTSTINKMNLNAAQRHKKEYFNAIQNDKDLNDQLHIVLTEEIAFEDPLTHQFMQNKINAAQFGKLYSDWWKAFSYNAYQAILTEHKVDEETAKEILNKYYEKVADIYAFNYEKVPTHLTALICIMELKELNQVDAQ
eukprot:403374587